MANTKELFDKIIAFHGGLDAWNRYNTIKAHVRIGGITWAVKGHEGALNDVYFTGKLHAQHAGWYPLFEEQLTSDFSPERVALLTADGSVKEVLVQPRLSFKGHTIETPWTRLQLVYFSNYATWNYLTTPFNFLQPGVEFKEVEPWQQNGETWRRLEVLYPESIATHSRRQLFYFSEDGRLRRHDYWPEVLGGSSATQIIEDYKEFQGIKTGTRRNIYILNDADNSYMAAPVLVSIDVLDIQFQ